MMPLDFDPATVPTAEIPAALAVLAALQNALAARLVAAPASATIEAAVAPPLLDAGQMAERLGVPESWVRTEARAGRIPSVEVGRYVRFREADVMAALTAKQANRLGLIKVSASVINGRGGNNGHENQATKKSRRDSARALGREGKKPGEDGSESGQRQAGRAPT